MKVKEVLCTVWVSVVFAFVAFIVYLLLMMLFSWMVNWWWVFIIIIGIGGIASITGFSQAITTSKLESLAENILGRVLGVIAALNALISSICMIWAMNYASSESKIITVKIIGTLVFAGAYLPTIIYLIFVPKH